MTTQAELERLRQAAETAKHVYDTARKRRQSECVHPFRAIKISQGAMSSYSAGKAYHQLYVHCVDCDALLVSGVDFAT